LESQTSTERSHNTQNDTDEIELILKPHPTKETTHSSKRFLKTSSNATGEWNQSFQFATLLHFFQISVSFKVSHLAKYLSTRLCVEQSGSKSTETQEASDFNLYARQQQSYQILVGNTTLDQIHDKYWRLSKPLELFYTFKATADST
jgi:E3 ubiquitin-protein ligase RNF1/2